MANTGTAGSLSLDRRDSLSRRLTSDTARLQGSGRAVSAWGQSESASRSFNGTEEAFGTQLQDKTIWDALTNQQLCNSVLCALWICSPSTTAFKRTLNCRAGGRGGGRQAVLTREGNTQNVIKGISNMVTYYLHTHHARPLQNKTFSACPQNEEPFLF